MKMKATRWIGMLLVAALLAGLLPVSAFAAPGGTMKATATLESHFGEGGLISGEASYTDTAFYSDRWFTKSSFMLNPSLATLSAITGGASYANGENQAVQKFIGVLEAFGFKDVAMNDYYGSDTTLPDSIGCLMGRKTIRDGSGSHTLLAVFFRNAGYRDEWYGDFNIGASGIHADFKAGRDETLRFMRQYVDTYDVSGDVKVWAAGYSRGAAVANLLGGFLAEEETIDYFDDVTIAPEDVFVYTIATPRTLPAELDTAKVWSVAGPRAEAYYCEHDTDGAAFTYTGESGKVDPSAAQYRGIHNYTAYGDYVTKLPPESWSITRYGTTEMVTYGGADMLDWLDDIPGTDAVAKSFADKDYLTELKQKTYDVNTFKLVETDYTISPDAMIEGRLTALMSLVEDRADFVNEGYQSALGAAAAVFGKDPIGFYNGVREAGLGTLAKAAVLNYLAYAQECQSTDVSDDAALAEVLLQILAYAGIRPDGTVLAGDGTDAQVVAVLLRLLEYAGIKETTGSDYTELEFLAGVLDVLINDYKSENPDKSKRNETHFKKIVGILPESYGALYSGFVDYAYQTRQQVDAYAASHDVAALKTSAAIYSCAEDTATRPDVSMKTADDLLFMLAGYVVDNRDSEAVQTLIVALAGAVPSGNSAGGTIDYAAQIRTFATICTGKNYEETMAGLEQAIYDMLEGCVVGFHVQDAGNNIHENETAGTTAGVVRQNLRTILGLALIWSGQNNISKLIYPESLYGGPAPAFSALVTEVLDTFFGKENGRRTSIKDAADAALRELIALGRTDKIGAYTDMLEKKPAALRRAAGAILFQPGENYNLASDVKNAVTFIDIITFLVPAHYHELYISWLKTQDDNYRPQDVPPYYPAGGGASEPKQSNPFRDIAKTDAYYDAVLWAFYHQPQITDGVTETTFVPGGTVKRGEAITFLWRAKGCPEPAGSEADCPFTDLTQDYYKKAVRWGYESGIIKGVTETTFDPEQPLSTAHIATLLYRTLNPGADGWYTEAAGWLTAGGYWKTIALAIDTGTDCPRAQVVMALYAMRDVFDKAA